MPHDLGYQVKILDERYAIMTVKDITFSFIEAYVNNVIFSYENVEGCYYRVLCEACVDILDYYREGKLLCTTGGYSSGAFHFIRSRCNVGVEKNIFNGEILDQKEVPYCQGCNHDKCKMRWGTIMQICSTPSPFLHCMFELWHPW